MVCEGLTLKSDSIDITELSPVCLEGRVIYAASFDPALERPRVTAVPERAPPPPRIARASSNSPETRLFVFGIAAGVIAAMALGQHSSGS